MLTVAWASHLRPVLDQGLEGPSGSMRNLRNPEGGRGEDPGPTKAAPSPEVRIRVRARVPRLLIQRFAEKQGSFCPANHRGSHLLPEKPGTSGPWEAQAWQVLGEVRHLLVSLNLGSEPAPGEGPLGLLPPKSMVREQPSP